jgi:hypothetical protein
VSPRQRLLTPIVAVLLSLQAGGAGAQMMLDEKPATVRQMAAYLAATSGPVEKRDLKAYCKAVVDRPGVVDLFRRQCQEAVKQKAAKAEECSTESLRKAVGNALQECQSMPAAEFENQLAEWREGLGEFLRQAKAQGQDGEKLIAEERRKLK